MRANFLLLLMYLSVGIVCAQNQTKADSLKVLVSEGQLSIDEKLETLYWLSTYSASPEEKLQYGKDLLSLAQELERLDFIIRAKCRIGVANRFLGNLGEALEFLFSSAEEASNGTEIDPYLADIYAEISTCYTQNGDSQNALVYGAKTISILRRTDPGQKLAVSLLNTGYDYYLLENYDSAMAYYNESEPILEDIGMEIGLAYLIGNRALVYWKMGNPGRAKRDLFTSIKMLEKLGDSYAIADYNNQLGNIFFEAKSYDKVIEYATDSYTIAVEEGMKEQARDASYLLFLAYQEMDDLDGALSFQSEYTAYKDSIQNLETTQRIANLRTEFEVGRKQVEVDLLLEQKKNSRIIMLTGGIILLGTIILVIIFYSYLRTKNTLNKKLQEHRNSLLVLNETKDKFFSIISHDLRGPVNTLSGLISVSKIYIQEGKVDHVSGMVERMENSMGGLVKLLDNLLNWALQQRGHFPYIPENMGAMQLLKEAVDTFEDMAVTKNVSISLEPSKEFKLSVDRNTASTIIRNLINNAVKFTPVGGEIKVHAASNPDSGFGIIKISDTGVGIPQNKLDTLFSLNEKISTDGTVGEKGLGLGLQLVVEFVALNKGKIDVVSEVGKGTTFTVSLPLA